MAAAPLAAAAPPPVVISAQAAAGLAPLPPEAIRFTVIQPDARGATIYEAGRGPEGLTRTLIDLSPGTAGWTVDARETKPVAAETLGYFRALIDAAIANAGEPGTCAAGPIFFAEHGAAEIAGCDSEGEVAAIARGLGLAEPIQP